jgi:hypothetical protein
MRFHTAVAPETASFLCTLNAHPPTAYRYPLSARKPLSIADFRLYKLKASAIAGYSGLVYLAWLCRKLLYGAEIRYHTGFYAQKNIFSVLKTGYI